MIVLPRNHLITSANSDVGKLTKRDIERILRQWVKEKPVVKSVRSFQIARQRVYQLINQYTRKGEYPVLRQSRRTSEPIDECEEALILETYQAHTVGPISFEKKIGETQGIYIPHNQIYRVLLNHGLVEINREKRQQR